ncbi:PREDICTED: kelch-like protein 13 [Branchiostoma belcheri]|uniref:Kelch-like protein 13 n=1 Tax=Branchiostoma belcheri TaxID=7741 RepID=A0A6P4ZL21_BRABE|nr:PREDICTED: kelch-like protein 13 [Branchiostoma belcheri]
MAESKDETSSACSSEVCDETQLSTFLESLNKSRNEEYLCDVVLVAEDKRFPVHKIVITSASEYFKIMFSTDMKEKTQEEVVLHGVTAEGLKVILQFIYTTKAVLTADNVHEVLVTAHHFQISKLVKCCEEFVAKEVKVDEENWDNLAQIASLYDLQHLRHAVHCYLLETINKSGEGVSCFEDKLCDLPVEQIELLLGSNEIEKLSELQLFHLAVRWLKHDSSHESFASRVIENIRFVLISRADLTCHVEAVDFMMEDVRCRQMVADAVSYLSFPLAMPLLQTAKTQVRASQTMQDILVIGGARGGVARNTVYRLSEGKSDAWLVGPGLPQQYAVSHHGVAAIDNFVYVIGGQTRTDPTGLSTTNRVVRYDPRTNTWIEVAPFMQARACFATSVLNGCIYVTGGGNSYEILNSVEKYNPKTNKWSFVGSLLQPCYAHASVVLDNKLYISGGARDGRFHKDVWVYDQTVDGWQRSRNMNYRRGWHAMAAMQDKLLVMGGKTNENENYPNMRLGFHTIPHLVESFDPARNEWTVMKRPLIHSQCEAGSVVTDCGIFLVGGYSWQSQEPMKTVQVYRPDENTWWYYKSLPEPLQGVGACAVTLPS